MRKNFIKLLIVTAIVILIVSLFVGCKKDEDKPSDESKSQITASVDEAVMVVGESFYLDYSIKADDENKIDENVVVEYTVEGDSVKVDENGVVSGEKTGESAVSIKIKDTDQTARCKIYVCNLVIDANANKPKTAKQSMSSKFAMAIDADSSVTKKNYGGTLGETLFDNFKDGLAKAKQDDLIIVREGSYDEQVAISQSVTIRGMNTPKLKGVNIQKNVSVTLENLSFSDSTYPEGNDARVYVQSGASLVMSNCVLSTTSTEELSGGYAVFAENQVKSIDLTKNTISNFRYGVYVCPTDGTVKIGENKLSNMDVGIGLDVRQENSDENYPMKGEIKKNEYNEVKSKTQFLHHGDNYSGEFDYEDNELENASKDEGQTGGSGLTE